MKELTASEIKTKWGPMLLQLGIPEQYLDKVCPYAHYHATCEHASMTLVNPERMASVQAIDMDKLDPSCLPIAIGVLKNIKDLSKVRFIQEKDPEFDEIQSEVISYNVTRDDIFKMKYDATLVSSNVENNLIRAASDYFNSMIDEGFYITFNLVVASVMMITEGTMAPKVCIKSKCFLEKPPSQSLI